MVNQKDKAVKISDRIQSYLARIKSEGIYLSDAFNKLAFEEVVKLIVGFPLYLIGGALNLLPFMLVKKIFRSIQIKEAFRGSLAMMIGLLIFLFWYLSLVVISTLMSGTSMIGILVLAGGYFLGLYAIYWSKLFFVFSQKINVYRMKKTNRKCYQEIKKEQKTLLEALNEFRAVFDLRNS